MRIDTAGTARIRHKDTGEIFDVEADELEWKAVGSSERQMGPETEYAAEVHHPIWASSFGNFGNIPQERRTIRIRN